MNYLNNDLDYNFGCKREYDYCKPIDSDYFNMITKNSSYCEPIKTIDVPPRPIPTYIHDISGTYIGKHDSFMGTLNTGRDTYKVSGNKVYNNFDRPFAQIDLCTIQPAPVYYNPTVWNPMDSI